MVILVILLFKENLLSIEAALNNMLRLILDFVTRKSGHVKCSLSAKACSIPNYGLITLIGKFNELWQVKRRFAEISYMIARDCNFLPIALMYQFISFVGADAGFNIKVSRIAAQFTLGFGTNRPVAPTHPA